MLYTSGTTAAPKAAVLSHEAVVRTALAWGRDSLGMSPEDTIWIPNPLFHIGAMSTMVASIGSGSRFLSMPFFEVEGAVRTLTIEEVTLFFPVFDAVAMPIVEHLDAGRLKFDKGQDVLRHRPSGERRADQGGAAQVASHERVRNDRDRRLVHDELYRRGS